MAHQLFAALLLSLSAVAQTAPVSPRVQEPNWGFITRAEEYKPVSETGYGNTLGSDPFMPACAHTADPMPEDTPNPMLRGNSRVVVDFIVGFDGKIYSQYVLEGGINDPDVTAVLRSMRGWRFHPGTCNGVPTNSEGRVIFRRQ